MRSDRLLDSSVWIRLIYDQRTWRTLEAAIRAGRIWLSSVAVAELYAGTRSRDDARANDRIVAGLANAERLVTPTHEEWRRAGQLIARRTRQQGAIRPRDHLAELLILLSAARLRGTVVTTNVRHFDDWLPLAAVAGIDVAVEHIEV